MHECCSTEKKGASCCSSSNINVAGRMLFGIPFMIFGLGHFLNGEMLSGMLAGWPFALFLVYVSGAGLFLGGLAILLNRYARLASLLLALELGLFIVGIHLPSIIASGSDAMTPIMYLLKDTALLGGALLLASQCKNRELDRE